MATQGLKVFRGYWTRTVRPCAEPYRMTIAIAAFQLKSRWILWTLLWLPWSSARHRVQIGEITQSQQRADSSTRSNCHNSAQTPPIKYNQSTKNPINNRKFISSQNCNNISGSHSSNNPKERKKNIRKKPRKDNNNNNNKEIKTENEEEEEERNGKNFLMVGGTVNFALE